MNPYNQKWDPAKDLSRPLRWRKPRIVRVEGDLFGEDVRDEFIAAIFGIMAMCPRHTFQILTKRADRLPKWFDWLHASYDGPCDQNAVLQDCLGRIWNEIFPDMSDNERYEEQFMDMLDADWPLPNVWLGVQVSTQVEANSRVGDLLRCPAAIRWVSYEPALEGVGFSRWLPRKDDANAMFLSMAGHDPIHWGIRSKSNPGLDWLTCGGGSDPVHPQWVRSARDQCVAASVPFFFKQWGSARPFEGFDAAVGHRWFDFEGQAMVRFRNKNDAGRIIDGRTWDEMPNGKAVPA